MKNQSNSVPTNAVPGLITAIDFGPQVRASAYALINGKRRLLGEGIAHYTDNAPTFDSSIGIDNAIQNLKFNLSAFMGRDEGDITAVSAATGSRGGRPIPALYAGDLSHNQLIEFESILRAQGFVITSRIGSLGSRFNTKISAEHLSDEICKTRPNLIAIALTKDRGWEDLSLIIESLRFIVLNQCDTYRPVIAIFYNGNPDQVLLNAFKGLLEVRFVQLFEQDQELGSAEAISSLNDLYQSVSIHNWMREDKPENIHGAPIVPINVSLGISTLNLSQKLDLSVTSIHSDPAGVCIACAREGSVNTAIFGYFFNGDCIESVSSLIPIDEILEWLPLSIDPSDALSYFANKSARPWTEPESNSELLLDHASTQFAITKASQTIVEEDFRTDLIVCTGSTFTNIGRPLQAAIVALNGLLPSGFSQFAVDRSNTFAAIGGLAAAGYEIDPEDNLVHVATSLGVRGLDKIGKQALAVELTTNHGERIARNISFGSVDRIAWPNSSAGKIKVWPAGRLDIGAGRGQAVELKPKIHSGSGGFIVDARGRPLSFPKEPLKKKAAILQWLQGSGAYALGSRNTAITRE
tara:strand:+ start:787 stop:2526 length:1740 start_codon:yes stop_codon:yes gene_type:complete